MVPRVFAHLILANIHRLAFRVKDVRRVVDQRLFLHLLLLLHLGRLQLCQFQVPEFVLINHLYSSPFERDEIAQLPAGLDAGVRLAYWIKGNHAAVDVV